MTTPHVLAEVSNLAKFHSPELKTLRSRFKTIVAKTEEIHDTAKVLRGDSEFLNLRLTDTAILLAAKAQDACPNR